MKNTTLCYLEQDGSWLLLHRNKKKNDPNHDKWIGIGGKFEETKAQTTASAAIPRGDGTGA